MGYSDKGMDFAEAKKFLPIIFQTKLRPCFLGHTGIGKTELLKAFAAEFGLDLLILHVAQLEPSDFVGLYKINEDNRTSNCPPSWLPHKTYVEGESNIMESHNIQTPQELAEFLSHNGYRNPKGGIVFLDEVNRAHEDMRQALYQFLQDGRIHTYSLPMGDKSVLNDLGLPMGKYHIACAANPAGEGYETYEFDPALNNRLAMVNFTPDPEETVKYLRGKHGSNPVTSWVDSDKGLIDMGEEFEVEGLVYSPRMVENHIILYNACRKEGKEFKRKVFQTIMPKDKLTSFMTFLEELEYVNYKDIMNGVKGEQKNRLDKMLKEHRMDVLSTITNDLSDFFKTYLLGESKHEFVRNEKEVVTNVVDFLKMCEDELACSFLDGLGNSYNNPKNIIYHPYFEANIKPKLKKYAHVFKG